MGDQTTTYIWIMTGLMLLFYFTGIATTNPLLNILLSPESMSTGTFYLTLAGAIIAGIGVIVIGALTKNLELAAMAVIVPFLFTILWSFIDVYVQVAAVNQAIAILIFGPLLFLFAVTSVDYWRGRD